jgi:hypothetical protein
LPSAALGQRAAASDGGVALLDGVVIAPQQGIAYVMRPGGGIDAVNLASGAVRWRSKSAAKPLALAGDRLVAQADSRGANSLNLVVLDPRNGAARDSVRIPLPEGVVATVVDTPAASFRVRADAAASKVVVSWEATKSAGPLQGYLPAENEGPESASKALAPSVFSGGAVVDLAAASPTVKAMPEGADSGARARAALAELETPLVASVEGRQWLSADERHVLVSEQVHGTGFTLNQHRWTVYERESGARLGSVLAMVSAMPFVVVGSTLYHVAPAHGLVQKGRFVQQPAALRAVNLKTGRESWKSSVRETDFRGPFPP